MKPYIFIFTVIILFITQCCVYTHAQEEESLKWISQYYGIGWPYGNCTQIPSNSSYTLTCDDEGYTTEIQFNNPLTPRNYGAPNATLLNLYFPRLKTLRLGGYGLALLYPLNILTRFTQVTTLETLAMGGNTITSIPDQIFINNVNLSFISCGACSYLSNAKLQLSSGKLNYISFTTTNMSTFSFGSTQFYNLTYIYLTFYGSSDFNFNESQFPKLDSLSLSSSDTYFGSNYLNVNVSSKSLKKIEYYFNGKNATLDHVNCINVTKFTLQAPRTNVNFIRPLSQSFPNLNALTLYYMVYQFPSLSGLDYLKNLDVYASNLTTTPYLPPSLTNIGFTGNTNLTQFADPFITPIASNYVAMMFMTNSKLTGMVPQAMCFANLFDLTGTSITDIPDCMKCYYGQIKSRLPTTFPAPAIPASCSVVVSPSNYLSLDGQTITITGNGMGWGNNMTDRTSTLYQNKGNTEFVYVFPQQLQYTSNNATLYFSYQYNYTATVSWVYVGIYIKVVTFTQITNGQVKVFIKGNFNANLPHTGMMLTNSGQLKNYTVTFPTGNLQAEMIVDQFDLSLLNLNRVYLINQYSNPNRLDYYDGKYIPMFPSYYSMETVPQFTTNITAGSRVRIYATLGSFYYNTTRVIINDDDTLCAIQVTYTSAVECILSTSIPLGTNKLQLDVTGFKSPINYFIIQGDLTCKNYDYCNGHGTCNDYGACVCNSDYSGDSCQFPTNNNNNNNGTIFQPNNTNSVASFEANGYQFNFTLVSIQELNIRDEIVTELLTNNWTVAVNESSTNTTVRYSLYTGLSNFTVTTLIIFTNQSSSYMFGGVNYTLPANSLKIAVYINGFPYDSNLNRLRVVFKTGLEDSVFICGKEEPSLMFNQVSKGVQYLKVVKNGVIFFGSFSDVIVSNGRPVYTVNELLNTTLSSNGTSTVYIGVVLPNCQQCIIDPDFSALIDPRPGDGSEDGECGTTVPSVDEETKTTWKIIVGAVVGGVAAIGITFASVVTIKKLKYNRKESAKIQKKLSQMRN